MGIRIDKALKQQLILFTILIMLLALFTSRALLSAGLIVFVLLTCAHNKIIPQLKRFLTHPLFIGISFLFLIPFISGLWSEDQHTWLRFVRIKLPLVLLPLCFAGDWQLSEKQWRWVAQFFLILVFAGCCWSLWQYLANFQAIHRSYLEAQVMPTPLRRDHVRFSLVVSIAIICAVLLLVKAVQRTPKILLALLSFFFIVYLHILSARTGLLAFYIFFISGFFYLLFRLKKIKTILFISVLVIAVPVSAWLFLPTFQNRLRYIFYESAFIRNNTYLPGANDRNRTISLRAGWSVLHKHPFGVGSGDLFQHTRLWYDAHIQQMLETDKIYPSSEWLMYGGFAGWPGMVLFTCVMVVPFFEKIDRYRFFWICLHTIMASSFLFDIGLENQFGVFIYAFILLWWWRWLKRPAA